MMSPMSKPAQETMQENPSYTFLQCSHPEPPSEALYLQYLFITVRAQLQHQYHQNTGSRDTLEILSRTVCCCIAALTNVGQVI